MIPRSTNSWLAVAVALGGMLATALLCFPQVSPTSTDRIAVIGLGVAVCALARPWVEIPIRRRRGLRWMVVIAWAVAVALLLTGRNLKADWSIIDDHEIVHALDDDGRMSLGNLAALAAHHPEIGDISATWPRYRPSYYLLRFLECYLWGDHPILWYISHIGLLAMSLALFWQFLWRCLGAVGACLLLLATLTYDFWADIFSRLGPAEAYAVAGVALYVYALAALARRNPVSPRKRVSGQVGDWVLLTVGALAAMGSKENFLILLPCTWMLAAWLWWGGRLNRGGWLSVLIVTATGLFIGGVVAHRLHQRSVDVYHESVAPSDRLELLEPGAWFFRERWEGKMLIAGAVLLAVLWCWAFIRRRPARWFLCRAGLYLLLGFVGAELLLVSQFVFYNADWPNENRYDFPGLLAFPALAWLEAWLAMRLLRLAGMPSWVRPATCAWLLAVLTGVVLARGFTLPEAVKDNVATTRWFRLALDWVVGRLDAQPTRPVLFVSHRAWDYEPVLSLKRFLAFRRVRNPIFLRLTYEPEDYNHPIGVDLARQLRELSLQGRSGSMTYPWTFEPLDRLPRDPRPLGIGFHGPPGDDTESLGLMWR